MENPSYLSTCPEFLLNQNPVTFEMSIDISAEELGGICQRLDEIYYSPVVLDAGCFLTSVRKQSEGILSGCAPDIIKKSALISKANKVNSRRKKRSRHLERWQEMGIWDDADKLGPGIGPERKADDFKKFWGDRVKMLQDEMTEREHVCQPLSSVLRADTFQRRLFRIQNLNFCGCETMWL